MIDVRRRDGRPWRIGHRGAAALAPENTLPALERAIAAGVDVIEFDVLALADGALVLAHSVASPSSHPSWPRSTTRSATCREPMSRCTWT